jgi:transposase InsO family protein
MSARPWLTAAEIAALALPGLPATKRGLNKVLEREGWAAARDTKGAPLARPRSGRGGGTEYHISLLPAAARAVLARNAEAAKPEPTPAELWAAYDALSARAKREAQARLAVVQAVETLTRTGLAKAAAVALAAAQAPDQPSPSTVWSWLKACQGVAPCDRLPALAPRSGGGRPASAIDETVYALFRDDWLRLSKPSFEACYRHTVRAATAQGLAVPPLGILKRKVLRDVPKAIQVLRREGAEAAGRLYPHLTRDRSAFAACEAWVADGHTFDVFVRWPDGEIARPCMVAVSDLYSNKILGWRFGFSESADGVKLAFGDAMAAYGLPSQIWLDNGRAFASKQVTGGQRSRYRFRVRAEEPMGMLTMLGIEAHWTKPYSGQSKPIERSFRDFAGDTAKHPAFEGAYTGNAPHAKPENYASRAVPLDEFIRVVEQEIAFWNARPGRRTPIAQGRSFDQVFAESYAASPVRRATPEQLRLALLSSEAVTPDRRSGAVRIGGNSYWTEGMGALIGQKVMLRFDPEHLHGDVHVYSLDGRFLMTAPCHEPVGFADAETGRAHARTRAAFLKAQKAMSEQHRRFEASELAAMQASIDAPAEPDATPGVIAPVFGLKRGNTALAPAPHAEPVLSFSERERLALAARANRELRLVSSIPEAERLPE